MLERSNKKGDEKTKVVDGELGDEERKKEKDLIVDQRQAIQVLLFSVLSPVRLQKQVGLHAEETQREKRKKYNNTVYTDSNSPGRPSGSGRAVSTMRVSPLCVLCILGSR